MKLADSLNFSAGLVAGAIVLAASAQAAPGPPLSGHTATAPAANVELAVVSQNEVDHMKPVQVHYRHRHWRHRHHWHHRHWRHYHWRHHH
ncbi:twin-arginine translocation (Tat) [Bradyrhizobium sp.]|uniref:twin-arginine translocation (Tat) n=1 Tax=Bradyrhizobium sp. TaxID=376 RepID=UPI002612ACFE|nr:twin-arginine translocation (Tat) [Bradyrhizobium sp.]